MKQVPIEKLSGLSVQRNSFTINPGSLEIADNCVLVNDNIISKIRGYRNHLSYPSGEVINAMFDFQDSVFAVSQSNLYRNIATAVTGEATSFSGFTDITVRRTAHGVTNGYLISDFQVSVTGTFINAFPSKQVAFYGTQEITTEFNVGLERASNVVTVTLQNHGMQTGDTVTILTSNISMALETKTITALTQDTFSVADTGSDDTGTGSIRMIDSFRISANENATSSVISGATSASYRYYEVVGGVDLSVTASGVGYSRSSNPNKSVYLTSDNGILKLEREDLDLMKAGIPPGLDLQAEFILTTGPIEPNTQVAYRILFGRKDASSALVLGSPSDSITLINRKTDVTASQVSYAAGIVTVDLGTDEHWLTTNDFIYLYSVVVDPDTYVVEEGTIVPVTVLDANSFTFDLSDAGGSTTGVTDVETLSYGYAKSARLTFSIPSELDSTQYIYQVYRTDSSATEETAPEPRYKLVIEENITDTQIALGFIEFDDEIDQILIESNPELYTNATREGELQSNFRPPLAKDIETFKSHLFMANVTDYRALSLSVVAPNSLTSGDTITIGTQFYLFRGDAANEAVGNARITSPATTTSYVEITQNNHGFLTGDVINVISFNGISGVATGLHTISATTSGTFRFSTGGTGSGTVDFEGVSNSTGQRLVKLTKTINNGETLSEAIALTARSLIKAINRNDNSVVYAQYVSAIDQSPGKMFLMAKNLDAATFALIASSTNAGLAFVPTLPTSGTTVSDEQSVKPNVVRISKLSEYEACPFVNEIPIGSESAPILRIKALRDSLIVIKTDGVFRINGDAVTNFSATALDTTIKCVAENSVAVLNNSVYCLSNQGVVQITDSSVRIVSRETVEPLFSAVIGDARINDVTYAVGYESERLYILSTIKPNSTSNVADQVYIYNYLTDQFTNMVEEKLIFSCAHLSSQDDKIYFIPSESPNEITKERKDQNRIDYTAQEYITNAIKAVVADAAITEASASMAVTFNIEHGLAAGDVVTVSRASATVAGAFSGGSDDVIGIRLVDTVVDEYTITIDAGSVATASTDGFIYVQAGLSEVELDCDLTVGSSVVEIYSQVAHGLVEGETIIVELVDSVLVSALADTDDLYGRRTVTVVDANNFTLTMDDPATASASGKITLSKSNIQATNLTLEVASGVLPQALDAIVSNNKIYKVLGVTKYSDNQYIAELQKRYKSSSNDLAFLHSGYKTVIKFCPISAGNVNLVKNFTEFQATFRNSSSCTSLTNYFTSDGFISSAKNLWDYKVGTQRTPIDFNGWGKPRWGQFPFGGDISIQRNFFTGPAVIYRTAIPIECFMATFIQPVIEHRVAGESFDLQNIALYLDAKTQRVSR